VFENLFTFDGIVLEIFGPMQTLGVTQLGQRFHRDLMSITIGDPDRKGARTVEIDAGGQSCQFQLGEDDQPVVEFLERVRAALPRA
jgi:hypothetical protein